MEETDLRFKAVFCDEAQAIRAGDKATNIAVSNIPKKAMFCVSGTFLHHHFYDVYGLIKLLDNMPFKSLAHFQAVFGEYDERTKSRIAPLPDSPKGRLFQRMLLGFTIARPENMLKVPLLTEHLCTFKLNDDEALEVLRYYDDYKRAAKKNTSKAITIEDSENCGALGAAQRALQAGAHWLLNDAPADEPDIVPDEEEGDGVDQDWFARVENGDAASKSSKLQAMISLLRHIQTSYPGERLVIFSIFVHFLDIVEVAFRKTLGIACLRLDGRRSFDERTRVLDEFGSYTNGRVVVMLVTAGVGGAGLNLQCARLMIQCEPWWVLNNEIQARKRLQRQGQDQAILVYSLRASNSPMEAAIVESRNRKGQWVHDLMKPLVRKDGDPIMIPFLDIATWDLKQ